MFDAGVNDKPCKSESCTSFQDQHSLFMHQVKHYDVRKQQQTRPHSSMTNGYPQNRVRIYSRNRPGGSISNDIREGTNVRGSERSRQNYSNNQHSQTPKQDRSKNYHGGFISNNVRCERNFQENYRSHQSHSRNQQEYISEQHNQPNEWQLISLNHAIPCAGCGDKNHSRLECPVTNKNTICNYCKINGHLEKACLKLSRRRIFEVDGRPMENPQKIHEVRVHPECNVTKKIKIYTPPSPGDFLVSPSLPPNYVISHIFIITHIKFTSDLKYIQFF